MGRAYNKPAQLEPIAIRALCKLWGRGRTAQEIGIATSVISTGLARNEIRKAFEMAARLLQSKHDKIENCTHTIVLLLPAEHLDVFRVFCKGLSADMYDVTENKRY